MLPLATAAQLNRSLQRTIDPDAAALALALASSVVRDYAGWSISAETVTMVVDGKGATVLNLPTLHLTEVTEVRVFGQAQQLAVNGWPSAEQYTWSQTGQLYRPCGWPHVQRGVEADVTHGYDVIPDSVIAVVLALAGVGVPNPGNSLVSKTVGGVSYTFRDSQAELSPLQIFQLSAYSLR